MKRFDVTLVRQNDGSGEVAIRVHSTGRQKAFMAAKEQAIKAGHFSKDDVICGGIKDVKPIPRS